MDYTMTADIPYITNGHERNKLDLYLPKSTTGPFPTIIYMHGGGFRFGSKASTLVPLRLISKNYAIASLNYRLSGDAIFPAAVQDCRAAVSYLRAHAATLSRNANRFVAMGESAGAYMALMVGLPGPAPADDMVHPSAADADHTVRGVVDFYGPTSFLEMDAHAPPGTKLVHNAVDSPESLFLGAQITEVPDLVRRASPLEYITDRTPPVLIVHGTADVVAPFHQSTLLHEKLERLGRDVTLYPVPGADHIFQTLTEVERRSLDPAVGPDHVFVPLTPTQQMELDGVVDAWLDNLFRSG